MHFDSSQCLIKTTEASNNAKNQISVNFFCLYQWIGSDSTVYGKPLAHGWESIPRHSKRKSRNYTVRSNCKIEFKSLWRNIAANDYLANTNASDCRSCLENNLLSVRRFWQKGQHIVKEKKTYMWSFNMDACFLSAYDERWRQDVTSIVNLDKDSREAIKKQ